MQSRIDRLEGLVLSLMTNGAQAPGLAAASRALERSGSSATDAEGEEDVDEMIKEEDEDDEEGGDKENAGPGELGKLPQIFGAMKVAKNGEEKEGMYIGDSHWHMVLADIKEVRNFWTKFQAEYGTKQCAQPPPQNAKSVALLYPQYPITSDSELRNALPPRSQIEALVDRFFSTLNPAVQVLHPPTFKSQLQAFFLNPRSHTTPWVGMLYAILSIAMQSYNLESEEPLDWAGRTKDMEALYRQRTVQAIVATGSDYSKIPAYTLETMVLYLHSEYAARGDFDVSLWLITGNAVRLAMRAGYHRDPAQFKEMDAFACEMRRRTWLYLRKIDILFSNQLALPSMIKSGDCDTQMPSNLFDDDFGPNGDPHIPLPAPQPDDVITPVSHLRSKGRLALLLGEILDETQGLAAPKTQYTTIISFDAQLRSAADAIPPHFRAKPIEQSLQDDPMLVLLRYHLDIIVNKITCVLHRRYVGLGNKIPRYALSRIRGVNAAMRLLELQEMIKHDSQPGGKLCTIKWDVGGMQRADFVLGAMVVCLDMAYLPRKGSQGGNGSVTGVTCSLSPDLNGCEELRHTRKHQMEALTRCLAILEEESKINMDAYKAVGVLRVMIDKIQNRDADDNARKEAASFGDKFGVGQEQDGRTPEQSAAMTLGMLSAGLSPNTAAWAGGQTGPTGLTPKSDMNMGGGYENGFMPDEALSPFTQMFGPGPSATSGPMDVPDNLDWVRFLMIMKVGECANEVLDGMG